MSLCHNTAAKYDFPVRARRQNVLEFSDLESQTSLC